MSGCTSRPGARIRRLNFGGGGKNMEIVFGACLAGIIVLAIVLSIWQLFLKGKGGGNEDVHFKCLAEGCGHEFTMTMKELGGPMMMRMGPGGRFQNCPECGGEQTAVQMRKCLDCEKHMVSARYTVEEYAEGDADNCPHCGKDQVKLLEEKMAEYRRDK